ncbi:MAG: EAL domain-containing protein [Cellulosilyticaceae bacterium]
MGRLYKNIDYCAGIILTRQDIYQEVKYGLLGALVCIILIGFFLVRKNLKELKKKKNMFTHAEESKSVILITLDGNGSITYCNKYALEKLGYSKEELLQKNLFEIILIEDQLKVYTLIMCEKHQKNIDSFDIKFKTKNFKKLYALCTIKFGSTLGGLDGIEISAIDLAEYDFNEMDPEKLNSLYEELAITEEEVQRKYEELLDKQEELKKSEERYSLVIDTASMGIWDWDLVTNKVFYSDKCKQILEVVEAEIGNWRDYIIDEDKLRVDEAIEENIKGNVLRYEVECRIRIKEQQCKWVYIVGKVVKDYENKPIRMTGSILDINQKKETDEQIRKIAFFDSLTNLPNKNYLDKEFEVLTKQYNEFTLLIMDTNNLKTINDCFGHHYGDLLLTEVATRLKNLLKPNMILIRISGDEFGVLICGSKSKSEILKTIEHIEHAFDEPFEINHISFVVSFSIGISIYPDNSKNFDELLIGADTAMYKAKEKGRRTHIFFDNHFKETIIEKVWVENNLRIAIKQNEFILFYQPQMDIKTGKIKGFEALIRWRNKEGVIIPPFKFIGVAEESGLIIPIGEWVIKEACTFINKLSEAGHLDLYVAVNVSVIQLAQEGFVEMLEKIITENKINPNTLHIEITETILMESIESNIQKMDQIKKMGVLISLDDFGKGYSSLTYLKQLPISVLKIEKAFVDDINESKNKNITGAIISLGHELGLKVVAEGVENKKQMDYLQTYNCDMIQGYLISRPVPGQEALRLITKHNNGIL